MKQFVALILSVFLPLASYSQDVDVKTAESIASTLLGTNAKAVGVPASVGRRLAISPVKTPCFYIFNSEKDNGGFAIISGDERVSPILGYSREGTFSFDSSMPPALEAYLACCSEYIAKVRNGETTPAPLKSSEIDAVPVVAPLCKSTWGQSHGLNELCPTVGGELAPVGCVATAMAQIMYMWKHPERPHGSISYLWEDTGKYISADFSSTIYEWDKMKDSWRSYVNNSAARAAASRLCYDCGVASEMQYGVDGSGTDMAMGAAALYTYFGYSSSKMGFVWRDCFEGSQEEWDEIFYNEFNNGRPVLYSANDSISGGHCFILDGYDTNGLMHVNWGWQGSDDGYFAITNLAVGSFLFQNFQRAVIGIEPDTTPDYEDSKARQFPMYMEEPLVIKTQSAALNTPITIYVNNIYNMCGVARTYTIGIALCDLNGEILQIVSSNSINNTNTFLNYTGFRNFPLSFKIPDTIPDGEYAIRAVCHEQNYDWALPFTVGGKLNNWISVSVKKGQAYFSTPTSIYNICVDDCESEVVSHTYYNINGGRTANPKHGDLIIDKQILKNGKVKTTKYRF